MANTPPWLIDAPEVDMTLTREISKKESPEALLALAQYKIDQQYGDCIQIYTDASRTTSGLVGIGCYIQPSSTTPELEENARLTNGVAIHTGEMTAIRRALEHIRRLQQTTTVGKYAARCTFSSLIYVLRQTARGLGRRTLTATCTNTHHTQLLLFPPNEF